MACLHQSVSHAPIDNHTVLPCVQWQALGALSAGMGFFATLYGIAAWIDKPSKVPFVSAPAMPTSV